MIYLFEDRDESRLASLFKMSYTDSNNLLFEGGAGNEIGKLRKLLNSYKGTIIVTFDLIPDNIATVKSYRELKSIKLDNKNLVVLPVVCAEFYFIQSLVRLNLLSPNENVDICINRGVHTLAPCYSDFKNSEYTDNFEGYCKYIVSRFTPFCIGRHGMIYFRESCKCNGSLDTCYNIELVKKSNRFILEYPCIPRGSNILSRFIQGIDESEFADIHNKCIDDYNEHVEKYIQAGFTRKKCLKISSMYR